jgi:hypothetical protein
MVDALPQYSYNEGGEPKPGLGAGKKNSYRGIENYPTFPKRQPMLS